MAKFADELSEETDERKAEPEAQKTGQPVEEQKVEQAQTPCQCQKPQEERVVGNENLCPHCKHECKHLDFYRSVFDKGMVSTDGISHILDYEIKDEDDLHLTIFKCPTCGALLFDNEDDVVDFLENK